MGILNTTEGADPSCKDCRGSGYHKYNRGIFGLEHIGLGLHLVQVSCKCREDPLKNNGDSLEEVRQEEVLVEAPGRTLD
jgi:hypothetical protein